MNLIYKADATIDYLDSHKNRRKRGAGSRNRIVVDEMDDEIEALNDLDEFE